MQNRKREKQIVIRLTEAEYEMLKNKVDKSGLSQQEFLIKAIKNKKITVIDDIKNLTFELKKIGINLNQIAHLCNEGKIYNCKKEIIEIQRGLADVWQLLRQLIQGQA